MDILVSPHHRASVLTPQPRLRNCKREASSPHPLHLLSPLAPLAPSLAPVGPSPTSATKALQRSVARRPLLIKHAKLITSLEALSLIPAQTITVLQDHVSPIPATHHKTRGVAGRCGVRGQGPELFILYFGPVSYLYRLIGLIRGAISEPHDRARAFLSLGL